MRRASRLPLDQLAPYLYEPAEGSGYLDWEQVFCRQGPVEIEIGFGKGLFLLRSAESRPEVNFLGIEIFRKYQLMAATRTAKRGLANIRLVKADARVFLRDHVRPASCQALHIYFPDPWWKKRHHKRRLFTEDFVLQCHRVLAVGGQVYIATDVEEYSQSIAELMACQTDLQTVPGPEENVPAHDMDYLTNFERKFRLETRPIFRHCYLKS